MSGAVSSKVHVPIDSQLVFKSFEDMDIPGWYKPLTQLVLAYIRHPDVCDADTLKTYGFGNKKSSSLPGKIYRFMDQPCPLDHHEGLKRGDTHFAVELCSTFIGGDTITALKNLGVEPQFIGNEAETALNAHRVATSCWTFTVVCPRQSEKRTTQALQSASFSAPVIEKHFQRITPEEYGIPDIFTLVTVNIAHFILRGRWICNGPFPSNTTAGSLYSSARIQVVTADKGKMVIGYSENAHFQKICATRILSIEAFETPPPNSAPSTSSSSSTSSPEAFNLPSSALQATSARPEEGDDASPAATL